MGSSWPWWAQTKAEVGEEENLLEKEEVEGRLAGEHPQEDF